VFRDLERRVVARLLDRPPHVLALGGGAFIDPDTRARVKASARSVWLRADLDTLVARTARKRGARPLLATGGDPREVLDRLMRERDPVYAEADHAVETASEGPEAATWRIVALVRGAAAPEAAA
jgi:shikimate kinase